MDDDPDFADVTATFLERNDDRIAVDTATSASDALDRLGSEIECIVSDYDMPGMNGVEFLRTVRAEYPDLPFILFTGKGSEAVAAEAVEADVSGYLQKGGTDTFELLANRVRNEVVDYRISTSYREYKTVVEALTDPVYVTDERGRFTDVNDAFLELTGYDEETVVGSEPSLIKSEDGVARAEEHLGRVLSEDSPDDALFEVDIQTADGETIPCEDHMGVIPFEGERFRGSVGVLRDISDRRHSERFRRRLYTVAADPNLGFEEKCRRLLEIGCERLDVDDGKLVRTDPETDTHETVVTARDAASDGVVAALSKTYCRRVVESGDLLALHDVTGAGWEDDPAYDEYGHECYVGVSVTVDGERYGTVCFFGTEPRPTSFTDAERTFVELVGRTIGQELERTHDRDDSRDGVGR